MAPFIHMIPEVEVVNILGDFTKQKGDIVVVETVCVFGELLEVTGIIIKYLF